MTTIKAIGICENCGAELSEDAAFCDNCGNPHPKTPVYRYCDNCGAELSEGAAFCDACGAARKTESRPAPQAEPSESVAPPKTESQTRAEEYNRIGEARVQEKRFQEGIENYTKAIVLDPSNAAYLANRALAHYAQADGAAQVACFDVAISAALDDYSAAIKLSPKDANLYYRRGRAWELLDLPPSALGDYRKALALDPSNELYRKKVKELENDEKDAQ